MNANRWSKVRTGIIIGGIGGYLYSYFYGCDSGSCSITSSPILSSLYGMAVGALILDSLTPTEEKPK